MPEKGKGTWQWGDERERRGDERGSYTGNRKRKIEDTEREVVRISSRLAASCLVVLVRAAFRLAPDVKIGVS